MPISTKQRQILAFPYTDFDALICDGAIRSGKTAFMTIAFIDDVMRRYDRRKAGICGKTVGSAVENVIKPFMALSWARERYMMKYSRSDKLLTVSNGKHTNVFEVFGGKDEASYALIQGRTLCGVLLDEAALMPRSFVEQAMARCSVDGSRFYMSCNPASPDHWLNVEWIQQADRHNALHLHFELEDNPSLSERIVQRYKSMYSGVFYDRYIRGLWVQAEGAIYPDYAQALEDTWSGDPADACVSIDYGTQNAFAALLWLKASDGVWHAVKEYRYSGRDERHQKTNREYRDDMLAFTEGFDEIEVIIDPSAAAMKAELRRCERFRVHSAKNAVLEGIQETATCMRIGAIRISRELSETTKELSGYVWDNGARDDKPLEVNDHLMDAMRYFVKTRRILARYDDDEWEPIF